MIEEYRNKTLQTVIEIFVNENKKSVASTGKAFRAVSFFTVAEYRLNIINMVAMLMREKGSTKCNHALA